MKPLILKEEWAIKCNNCGGDCHCETRSTRKEYEYPSEGGKEYEIEVCGQCRCKECE